MKLPNTSNSIPQINYLYLPETDSTNTFLKSHPRQTDAPCVVAWTGHQTAGRGQRGNRWESEKDKNLLCTLMHYPTFIKPEEQFIISQLISICLIDALQACCPEERENFRIKWPNDIYWKDKKLAGILIEYELNAEGITRAMIGVGLNVNQETFASDAPNPVSLCQITGKTFDIQHLLTDLCQRYFSAMEQVAETSSIRSRREEIDHAYHACLYRLGIPARYRDANGIFTGTMEGVADDGRLVIRDDKGDTRLFAFKEVSFLIEKEDGKETDGYSMKEYYTDRLILRRWRDADAPALYKYASDPIVGPRAGWPPHKDIEESLNTIRTFFSNDSIWAIVLRETNEPIGCIGYLTKDNSNIPIGDDEAEVGYWVARPYWDQGICTEALEWLTNHCFQRLHLAALWGTHFTDNPASGRVMEKCQFFDTGETALSENLEEGNGKPLHIMKRTRG